MTDSRNSSRARKIVYETHLQRDDSGVEFFRCNICGGAIILGVDPWRADHWPVPFALGGRDEPSNLVPIHTRCDAGRGGKAAKDTTTAAKVRRTREKHIGLKTKQGFRRPRGLKFNWREGRYEKSDD